MHLSEIHHWCHVLLIHHWRHLLMSCIDDVKTTNKQAKSQQLASMTILNVNYYLINPKLFFQPRTLAHLMILMLLLLMRFFQPRTSSWCQLQNCRGSTGCLTAPPKDSRCDLSDERSLSNKTSVHSLCVNRVLRGFVESIEIKSCFQITNQNLMVQKLTLTVDPPDWRPLLRRRRPVTRHRLPHQQGQPSSPS